MKETHGIQDLVGHDRDTDRDAGGSRKTTKVGHRLPPDDDDDEADLPIGQPVKDSVPWEGCDTVEDCVRVEQESHDATSEKMHGIVQDDNRITVNSHNNVDSIMESVRRYSIQEVDNKPDALEDEAPGFTATNQSNSGRHRDDAPMTGGTTDNLPLTAAKHGTNIDEKRKALFEQEALIKTQCARAMRMYAEVYDKEAELLHKQAGRRFKAHTRSRGGGMGCANKRRAWKLPTAVHVPVQWRAEDGDYPHVRIYNPDTMSVHLVPATKARSNIVPLEQSRQEGGASQDAQLKGFTVFLASLYCLTPLTSPDDHSRIKEQSAVLISVFSPYHRFTRLPKSEQEQEQQPIPHSQS